ncbi:MAG: DUF167 domain-containing protein [Thermoleophilia bacterium]|nr:DUF167 domain-containing protein [Thermoleophilia bacterium]
MTTTVTSAGRQEGRGAEPLDAELAELAVRASAGGLLVGFRVSPGAKVARIQGRYGDRLKVQVTAPPEAGRANDELCRAMAVWLGLKPDYVRVHAGHKKRDKVLAFRGVEEADLRERLFELLKASDRPVRPGLRFGATS